jgi:Domain of unknown function (DUF397)
MQWRRATDCDTNTCVEVKMVDIILEDSPRTILVRSSSDPTRTLAFTEDEWDVFVAAVKSGEFNL